MPKQDIRKSVVPVEVIEQKIFFVRGQKVMIGVHLAGLYGVETRVLMQAVRRNLDRFPADFAFALTRQEIGRISQFGVGSINSVEKNYDNELFVV